MSLPQPLKRVILAGLRAVPPLERRVLPSSGYRLIDRDEVSRLQTSASGWKRARGAAWQQAAYEKLIAAMRAGQPRSDFVVAAAAIDAAGLRKPSLLEVGCGGGYHSLVFDTLCACDPNYTGNDYSAEMVASATARFPGTPFAVADTTALPHADGAFDIVFDGVSLMHIPDFARALAEIGRVARSHVVLHSVPVFEDDHPTQYLFKYAYGGPVTEAVYGRAELGEAIAAAGLVVERTWRALDYNVHATVGSHSHSITYLCRKVSS